MGRWLSVRARLPVLALGCLLGVAPASAIAQPWSSARIDTSQLNDLSCSYNVCGAVDSAGSLMDTGNLSGGAGGWSIVGLEPGVALRAVWCDSADCDAIDGSGSVILAENRHPWVKTPPNHVDGSGSLSDIACADQSPPNTGTQGFCALVDDHGNAIVSTNPLAGDYATWTAPFAISAAGAINAITCPTPSVCVAVGAAGDVITSTDPTAGASATWTPVTVDAGSSISDISCPAATPVYAAPIVLCAAVDSSGHVLTSTHPTGGAAAWTVTKISSSPLTGVSCDAGAKCVAIDGAGNAIASGDPQSRTPHWTATRIDAPGKLESISCDPGGIQCAAVDSSGLLLRSSDPFTTSSGTGTGGGPTPSPTVPAQTDAVSRNGITRVRISCGGGGACNGTLSLTAKALRQHRPPVSVQLGSTKVSVQPGAAVLIAIHLSAAGRRFLHRHHGSAHVKLALHFSRGSHRVTVSRTISLVAARH